MKTKQINPTIKVLVVEDEAIVALNIIHSLEKYGCDCRHTMIESEIFQYIQEWNPDVILMDVHLGKDVNGIEIAEKIFPAWNVPIIFLTAHTDDETLTRAKQTMPDAFLMKPFNARELYISIQMATYRRQSVEELQKIQKQIEEKRRLESIGFLAGGISHEINNPLMSILNYVDLIKAELENQKDLNPKVMNWLDVVSTESQRVEKVVKGLISFTRNEKELLLEIDLSELFHETLALITQLLIREKVNITIDIEEKLPRVYCKIQNVKEMFLHLIHNAREAMQERKEQEISSFVKTLLISIQTLNPEKIRILVQDNGIGMNVDETQKSLFPFYTTKRSQNNMGLGLAMVHKTVLEHGGDIFVESKPNEGTVVRVDFPTRFPIEQ